MPVAATENVAVAGAVTEASVGCVVIDGTGAGVTVSDAADRRHRTTELDTVTSNFVPLCAGVVGRRRVAADVAPLIAVNDEAPGASLDH